MRMTIETLRSVYNIIQCIILPLFLELQVPTVKRIKHCRALNEIGIGFTIKSDTILPFISLA